MPTNYLDILSKYYPDTQADTAAAVTDYNSINWVTAQISQAALDIAHLIDYKVEKTTEFAELATLDIIQGFESSALGYQHWYDSELEDQINLIGAVATASNMEFSCRDFTQGYQEINVGGAIISSTATGYANNTTNYTAEIKIDGTSTYISFAGQLAQTYGDLIALLNADVDFSALATISILSGDLKIVSLLHGSSSAVEIIDTDVFLTLTTFVQLETSVAGIYGKDNPTKEYELHTHAQLLVVINDGKDIKLTVLQKFNVKKGQILAADDEAAVDAILW